MVPAKGFFRLNGKSLYVLTFVTICFLISMVVLMNVHLSMFQESTNFLRSVSNSYDSFVYLNSSSCRNTAEQSLYMIVDSTGRMCTRRTFDVGVGCCNISSTNIAPLPIYGKVAEFQSTPITQFLCLGCLESHHCCRSFELCISCCMHPFHQEALRQQLATDVIPHFPFHELVGDSFGRCMYRCRTNSRSVQFENSYSGPYSHCFYDQKSPILVPSVNSIGKASQLVTSPIV